MYVLGKLHRANEFTALRAAGVGLGRITAPVWLVGLAACGLTWWLNTTVVPWSVEESARLKDGLQFRKQSSSLTNDHVGAVYSVGFDNPRAGHMWFFNRYSQFTEHGYGISVSILDPRRRETRRILAAEGYFAVERGWVFLRGRELHFDPETNAIDGTKPFTELVEPTFREDPKLMLLIDRKPIDLSLRQLRRLMDYFAVENNPKGVPYAVRYFGLIADTFAPLIVIAIAIPFAVTGVRVNPAVGVSKSIGLFFVYYILSNFGSALASRQIVDVVLAAWVPNIGMSAVAVWLFWRMR
jgi:lipopolysaccharide export system permease protein